jgi:hypothetical protein
MDESPEAGRETGEVEDHDQGDHKTVAAQVVQVLSGNSNNNAPKGAEGD